MNDSMTVQAVDWLMVSDAARVLGTCARTVRAWEGAGMLPSVRAVNGVRLFRRSDVVALAEARETAKRRRAGLNAKPPALRTAAGANTTAGRCFAADASPDSTAPLLPASRPAGVGRL